MGMESNMKIEDFETRSLIKVRDIAYWRRVVKELVETGLKIDLTEVVERISRRKVGE